MKLQNSTNVLLPSPWLPVGSFPFPRSNPQCLRRVSLPEKCQFSWDFWNSSFSANQVSDADWCQTDPQTSRDRINNNPSTWDGDKEWTKVRSGLGEYQCYMLHVTHGKFTITNTIFIIPLSISYVWHWHTITNTLHTVSHFNTKNTENQYTTDALG